MACKNLKLSSLLPPVNQQVMGGSHTSKNKFDHKILSRHRIRRDSAGDGRYGAPRGSRTHRGVDLVAAANVTVLAPFSGKVLRHTLVYKNPKNDCQKNLRGIVINGTRKWREYQLKVFYLIPSVSPEVSVSSGQMIGRSQSVSACYKGQGMINHVHIELRKDGRVIDPTRYIST